MHDFQVSTAKAFNDTLIGHEFQFLDGHGMWVVEDNRRVSQFQRIAIMVDENLAEAAVGMQFENGNQMFLRELLAQGLHAGIHL